MPTARQTRIMTAFAEWLVKLYARAKDAGFRIEPVSDQEWYMLEKEGE